MASIELSIPVATTPESAWEAVRDFGAVDRRLVPGFLTGCSVDGDDRVVTFSTGAVARERLVPLDDDRRRLVYSVVDGAIGLTHHQASVEVVDTGSGSADGEPRVSTIRWSADLLPDDLAPTVRAMMAQGAAAIARTLGAGAPGDLNSPST